MFRNLFVKHYRNYWKNQVKSIPRFELEAKHVQNTQLIVNRDELLDFLPKNAVVAEVGVDKGKYSELIIKITQPKKLHLIDCWNSSDYPDSMAKEVEHKFKEKILANQVTINRGLSTEVVSQFENYYFDWVYIDTDHTYDTTKKELEMYRHKVKKGGMILGHDFIIGVWNSMSRFGVIEAVHEFCVLYDWEFVFLTMENKGCPSFGIREISPK